jgi:hypothetical protein
MPRPCSRWSHVMVLRTCAVCVWVAVLAAPATAQRPDHETFTLGPTRLLSNQLKIESLGIDLTNAFNGALSIRHALNERVDLSIDLDWLTADASPREFDDADFALANVLAGPGVRYFPTRSSLRPFVQANVFYVSESISLTQFGTSFSAHKRGAGFGLMGGIELLASHSFSVPIVVQYHYARPADDVSGVSFMAGGSINFDWRELGRMRR